MTLLQHLNSSSYVSNDAEVSEILRMKNQKRIQNVMTGGGIIFDNTAKIEKEQKASKTSAVLINDFDNDFINSLFSKKFTLDEKSAKNSESELLSNSVTSESRLLSDHFPLLNSTSAQEVPLSSPLRVECESVEADSKIELNFCEPLKRENPFAVKPQISSLSNTFSSSKVDDVSSRTDFPNLSRSTSQSSLNIFSLSKNPPCIDQTSQKLSDSNLFDFKPISPSKNSQFFITSQSCLDTNDIDTFESNLNDLSSSEKNIADKDPFAPQESNVSNKTVFNIISQSTGGHNFSTPSTDSSSLNGIFKVSIPKLPNGDSVDLDEDDNNNISSDSDGVSDCESTVAPIKKEKKSVNNIQILSTTLKSLKLSCWYYENLSHFEAIKLLSPTQPGTFLVRNSRDSKFLFTLSIQTYRQPTSIRIQYNDGKFCLDCENSVTETIPKFNSIMELIGHYIKLTGDTVHYINNNVLNENKQVLIDEYGKIFSNILLTKPLYSSTKVPSLKHLARINLNRFTEFGYSFKIPSEELQTYMNEYPFTI